MDAALDALRQSTEKLAESVLPAGAPAIAAVPAAIRPSDIDSSRQRLQEETPLALVSLTGRTSGAATSLDGVRRVEGPIPAERRRSEP